MNKVLYVDRVYIPQNFRDRRYVEHDKELAFEVARNISEGNPKLGVDVRFNAFDDIPEILTAEQYIALVTNFPQRRTPSSDIKSRLEKYRIAYQESLDMLKRITTSFVGLPVIVYTGIGSGEEADPSTLPATTLLNEAGIQKIVFKKNPALDGIVIREMILGKR